MRRRLLRDRRGRNRLGSLDSRVGAQLVLMRPGSGGVGSVGSSSGGHGAVHANVGAIMGDRHPCPRAKTTVWYGGCISEVAGPINQSAPNGGRDGQWRLLVEVDAALSGSLTARRLAGCATRRHQSVARRRETRRGQPCS